MVAGMRIPTAVTCDGNSCCVRSIIHCSSLIITTRVGRAYGAVELLDFIRCQQCAQHREAALRIL